MADGHLGRLPDLFARMASCHSSERDSILTREISQIKCEMARRGMMGSSVSMSEYHKACQLEMDARGAEMLANLKRIVSDLRLCPSPGMAEAIKGIFRPYLVREADKLTQIAHPKTDARIGGVSVQAVRPKCEKYDVEIDLFVESISATAAMVPALPSVSVAAADGSHVLVQIGGSGNNQNVGGTSGGMAVLDALVGQLRERVRPGFAISDETCRELAPMVAGLLMEAGRYHGNKLLVQALRDYKNTLDWILQNRGTFESISELDDVNKELEDHYLACVAAINAARSATLGSSAASISTDSSNV